MKYPSEKEVLELLKRYKVPEGVIEHSLEVKNTAVKIAKQIQTKGNEVDLELITSAALLHDIGRTGKGSYNPNPPFIDDKHAPKGYEILKRLGYDFLANIASSHFLTDVSREDARKLGWPERNYKLPDTPEAKIVCIADCFGRAERNSLQKYTEYLKTTEKLNQKYFNHCPRLKEKTIKGITKIWEELERLGMNLDGL